MAPLTITSGSPTTTSSSVKSFKRGAKVAGRERKHRQKYLPYAVAIGAVSLGAILLAEYTKGKGIFRDSDVTAVDVSGGVDSYDFGRGDFGRMLEATLTEGNGTAAGASTERLTGVINGTCVGLHGLPDLTGGINGTNVVISIILILWSFVGLAIVCDEFFQPSLEAISDALSLSPDVAGATFLAAGSSAPELFTSLADAFGSSSSIGMGTIVGSAMFNILVIVALSAAIAGRGGASLTIDYRPVSRDVGFYSYSILLSWIFFRDGEIVLYEATIMWVSYLIYIAFMTQNEKVMGMCKPPESASYKVSPEEEYAANEAAAALSESSTFSETQRQKSVNPEKKENGGDDEELESRFQLPESAGEWPMFIMGLPLLVLFSISIPDCATKKWEKWYVVSFISSILWIGVLCHIMVEFAVGIACICKIEPIIMGILVLAVGTSVPDAIGSMIAARNGEADMAIANAVGSNVFDVLLGLGFPWFLAIIIRKLDFYPVAKDGIELAVLILFVTVLLFVAVLAFNKWQMNTNVGKGLFSLYVLYVVFTILTA